MEAISDFSTSLPSRFPIVPYAWHISHPGGATLERIASALYFRVPSRQKQIELCLKAAESAADKSRHLRIQGRKWILGQPTLSLPILRSRHTPHSAASIALAPVRTFAEEVRDHFKAATVREVRVAGGLSKYEWLRRYIEQVADIRLVNKPTVQGAEGAALFALAAYRDFPTLAD
jgi:sugar (pentulose or hexulose) kinase